MRSEQEMLDLILQFARQRDEIRVVVLNGSRANPNAPRDPFQDYDILCLVTDIDPFRRNPSIPAYFGEMLILQTPEDMLDPPAENDGHYTYLMQFIDGNRIDLSFFALGVMDKVLPDSLTEVLLDKDGLLPPLPPSSDRDYLPTKPTAKAFADCVNEFWWLCPYVAKGLWRSEPTYTFYMREHPLREQLMKMLTWYFGVQTGFQKSAGKCGKYLREGIGEELWQGLLATYSNAQSEHAWDSLFAMGEVFRQAARAVAQAFGFIYPVQEERNVTAYLRRIRAMPPDARAFPPLEEHDIQAQNRENPTAQAPLPKPGKIPRQ